MDKRPMVGVGVIIIKDDKVLLLKRKSAHGDGSWAPPGGHLEFNETPQACAMREVDEELGIKIKNPMPVAFTNDIFEKEGKHYITLYVRAEYDSGDITIKEPEKCEQVQWFDCNALPSPLFIPVQNLLNQGFSLK